MGLNSTLRASNTLWEVHLGVFGLQKGSFWLKEALKSVICPNSKPKLRLHRVLLCLLSKPKQAKKFELKKLKFYKTGQKIDSDRVANIRKLIKISSYKGLRHFKGLPVRGQRTKTNAKTSRRVNRKI